MSSRRVALGALAIGAWAVASGGAQAQTGMPNFREMSGSVLPVTDLAAGTVSVRLVRGGPDKPLAGQQVEFVVDGAARPLTTDDTGRAEVSGLARGTRVRVSATVDGERLDSQEAVVGTTGLRIILVAADSDVAPEKGVVVLGPESRIIAEMSDDRLTIYYLLQIVNSAATPVDIGGPLIFDLPVEARGATVLDGSTPQATASGARITVTGPFSPGTTSLQAAYELPYSGDTARIDQRFPAALPQLTVLVEQIGGLAIQSPQLSSTRDIVDQGQALILGTGPTINAGDGLSLTISGLPHHARWPRMLALAIAGVVMAAGIWGAATARPRRRSR